MTEQKKRRKAARRRVDRPVFCPPDAAGRSPILRILGTICRLVTIFCAAYGLSSLVLSAFFPSADMEPVLLVTFVVVMLVGAMRQHPITTAVGGVLMASGAVYYLISRPYGALGYLRRVFGHGYNAVIDRLYKRGSYGLLRYKVAVPSGGSQAEFVQAFCVLVATVIALLFVLCLIRRVRALWPSLISVLLLVPLFVYNLTVQNGPVLFLIVGISGVLILLAYDRCYRRVDERDTTSTMLFPDHRPPLPEGMTDARQLRRERRELRRQVRIEKRENASMMTVEQELDDYFRTSKRRPPKKTAKKEKESLTEHKKRAEQMKAVRRYDRVTAQTRAAMGGFAGAAMTLLATIILLIPTLTVDGSFRTIDSIDRRVEIYREYVTALLQGDEVSVEMYEYLETMRKETPHSTMAEPLSFDEILLMRVGSQFYSNLYLPNYIGVDYSNGAWQHFSDKQYDDWRTLYGKEAMPSERMLLDFLLLMDYETETAPVDYVKQYRNRVQYGIVSYMVSFDRKNISTNEALLPRVYSSNYGLLQYRTNEALDLKFGNVYDGLCVGRGFEEEDISYSLIAYVPVQANPNAYMNRAQMIAKYNELYSHTEGYKNAQTYANFVYDTYLGDVNSPVIDTFITELMQEMAAEKLDVTGAADRNSLLPATYEARHRLAMAIIDKLVLENTYTREPSKPTDASLDGVENFLGVTNEGYCVQFASAATLILREFGIPARYVEGYLASDFELDIYDVYGSRYHTDLRDSDAHAWVEVWYDGMGWITYETTPPYYVDMYGEESDTAGDLIDSGAAEHPDKPEPKPPVTEPDPPVVDPDEPIVPPVVVPPVVGPVGPSIDWDVILRAVLIGLAASAVVGLIVWLIVRMVVLAKRAENKRRKLAEDILSGDEAIFGDETARADASHALIRQTMSLLSMYGTPPETGELKDEYAHRLSFAYESVLGYPMEYSAELENAMPRENVSKTNIGSLLDAIAAEEFGYGMTPEQMKRLAEFYLTMREHAKTFVKAGDRFKLHYIKREL